MKARLTLAIISIVLFSFDANSQALNCSGIEQKQPRLADCSQSRNSELCNLTNDYKIADANLLHARKVLRCEFRNSVKELKNNSQSSRNSQNSNN
ncbi:MAG: hypothetical protein SFT90_06855 [Rickettsiales bacterium]|nr:hypothetical protein [Rickettsiales bacterium]